jgi:hypothetical protein
MTSGVVAAARRLADEVLFPGAMRVDGLDAVPVAQLDALAAEGLYGAAPETGGLGLDLATTCAVAEELASGCLATTFVWVQHRGLVTTLAAASTPAALRDRWLELACQGKVRGGIALGGLIPNASVTVHLCFDGVTVPADRFASQQPFDPAASLRPDRLRINGSLALGVAGRCGRLLGPGPLDDELAACRARLDDALRADSAAMAEARAAASELAVRAAAALAVWDGSKSIMTGQHAQRLAREALFLLVFGSRPAIKRALLRRLGAAG